MTEYIDKTEAMRRFKPFGREIPKEQVMAVLARIEALNHEPSEDLISRAEAIEAIEIVDWYHQNSNKDMVHGANDDEHQAWYKAQDIYKALEAVPSADRQRGECRTCGRNADNGGVHEDGRTKCPIQEHYALLLDGYCHLYEPYKGGADMRGDTE